MSSERPIIKITFDGEVSAIIRDSDTKPISAAIDSSGNLWTIDLLDTETYYGLYVISDPGGGSESRTLYYLFDISLDDGTPSGCWQNMKIFGNNLYFIYQDTNYKIIKFTDITGTANMSIIDTGLLVEDYKQIALPGSGGIHDMLVVSDTIFYFIISANTKRSVLKFAYNGTSWQKTTVIPEHDFVDVTHGNGVVGDIRPLQLNSYGDFILSGILSGTTSSLKIYDSNWILLTTLTIPTLVDMVGCNHFWGSEPNENLFSICGYTSDDVWKIYPDGYWVIIGDLISDSSSAPTMLGVIVNIVSNYEDLGMSNNKRIKRMYLDVESQYQTCGAVTIEPDYDVNRFVHTDRETTEPSGATSLRPFFHSGRQTWKYVNNQFDSSVEAWQDTRIDVSIQGKKFRYSLKIGDVATANHGILRIRVPRIDIQIKEKY